MRYFIPFLFLSLQMLTQVFAQENMPRFRRQVVDDKISIGYGLAIGDVDGDKKPDIILADKKQVVWYRNGNWEKTVIAENLTESDNVCVAAADIDGDGKVEIAVGAQWNPGETADDAKSGAVFYLKRPAEINGLWQPVKLHHEPTVHRMKWIKSGDGKFYLVVAPLHGRGNKQGEGRGVKILAYQFNGDGTSNWPLTLLDSTLHLTHNFIPEPDKTGVTTAVYIASKEGVRFLKPLNLGTNSLPVSPGVNLMNNSAGEISLGNLTTASPFISTIEPMHGNSLVVYEKINDRFNRTILDSTFNEGHGIAAGDFLNLGNDQVLAGWRQPNSNGKTGLKIYARTNSKSEWKSYWLDEGGIAVEDVQAADLNGDGKVDIIASGRSTRNVVIYWNEGTVKK
ncbi:FG-GAP-like repeat-containing protein [Flavitalea sp.]|nr:FG-GAP-like repeat-containing protein [Flavitalea sp.]